MHLHRRFILASGMTRSARVLRNRRSHPRALHSVQDDDQQVMCHDHLARHDSLFVGRKRSVAGQTGSVSNASVR